MLKSSLRFGVLIFGFGLLLGGSDLYSEAVAHSLTPPGLAARDGWQQDVDQHIIATMMPHQASANALAELALERSNRPEIRRFSRKIVVARAEAIQTMRRWYRQWFGADVPASFTGAHHAWGMGMHRHGFGMHLYGMEAVDMPGMLAVLRAPMSGSDFDRNFLDQMIRHHRIGVTMANHVRCSRNRKELCDFQARIVKEMSQEIEQMQAWYRKWYLR